MNGPGESVLAPAAAYFPWIANRSPNSLASLWQINLPTIGVALNWRLKCYLLNLTTGCWEFDSMKSMIGLTSTLALLFAVQAHSDEMIKCASPSGHATFVQHQCPESAVPIDWIDVNNLPPSGAGTPTLMADPAILDNRQTMEVTVVDSGPKPRDLSPQTSNQRRLEAQRDARAQRMKNEATRTSY